MTTKKSNCCWPERLTGILAIVFCSAATWGQDSFDSGDVFSRASQAASRLAVDGRESDWDGIQLLEDWAAAPDDVSRDIVAVGIAPTPSQLIVVLVTRDRPATSAGSYWIDVDFHGYRVPDIRIGVAEGKQQYARIPDAQGNVGSGNSIAIPGDAQIDEVVEIRLDWNVIGGVVAADAKRAITSGLPRNWVRVSPFTYDPESGAIVDYGPAVASYILRGAASSTEVPAARNESGSVNIEVPVDGMWYVSQGPFSPATHAKGWAYDLAITDIAGGWSDPPGSARNEDYYAWNADIYAPSAGRVTRVIDGQPDLAPNNTVAQPGDPNGVFIELAGRETLHLAHFRNGSIEVAPGASLKRDEFLGRIGNSGNRSSAHLHFSVSAPNSSSGNPVAFKNVTIRLNPVEDDVWASDRDFWPIREGFYVERMP